jgi:hypothetical protein
VGSVLEIFGRFRGDFCLGSGREKDLVTLFCGSSDDLCELLVRPVRVRAVMGLSRCRKVDALMGADITFEVEEGSRCQRSIFVEVG